MLLKTEVNTHHLLTAQGKENTFQCYGSKSRKRCHLIYGSSSPLRVLELFLQDISKDCPKLLVTACVAMKPTASQAAGLVYIETRLINQLCEKQPFEFSSFWFPMLLSMGLGQTSISLFSSLLLLRAAIERSHQRPAFRARPKGFQPLLAPNSLGIPLHQQTPPALFCEQCWSLTVAKAAREKPKLNIKSNSVGADFNRSDAFRKGHGLRAQLLS